MNIIVAMSNNSGLSNSQTGDIVFYNSSNTSTRILFGTGQNTLPSMVLSSNNMVIQGNITMNNAVAVNGLYINMNNGLTGNLTTSSITGFSNTNNGILLYMPSNTSNNTMIFTGSNTTLATLTGTANLYVGSNVGPGYSNYPTDLSGVTGNIIVSGNISAGNLGMFRNRIINGNMVINQRGIASTTTATNGGYLVDRFFSTSYGTGVTTMSSVTLVNTDTPYQYGFRNSFKNIITTAFGASQWNYQMQVQSIEGNNIQDFNWGQTFAVPITLSFWSRTYGITNLPVTIRNSTSSYCYNTNVAVTSNSTWQYNIVTIPVPPVGSAGTWDVAGSLNGTGMWVLIGGYSYTTTPGASGWVNANIIGTSASSPWLTTVGNYVEFTGVQLEKGTIATPFEFRPFSMELQLCQRYFSTSYDYGTAPGTATVNGRCGTYSADTNAMETVSYPVAMRTDPTVTIYAGNSGVINACNLGSYTSPNYTAFCGQNGQKTFIFLCNNAGAAGGYWYYFQYSANAEL